MKNIPKGELGFIGGSNSRIKLLDRHIQELKKLPESGMGYQKVTLFFKGGAVLHNQTIVNCDTLLVSGQPKFEAEEIERIEIE